MKINIYNEFTPLVLKVRIPVFVEEQGFEDEIDEIDNIATHFVMLDGNDVPVATCRVFKKDGSNTYILGRLCVVKEYRGKTLGSEMVKEAEKYVINVGGDSIELHSQCSAKDFYTKLGFCEYGEKEDEQGCPHIWMRKSFN